MQSLIRRSIFLLVALAVGALPASTRQAAPDYQKVADGAGWGWTLEKASPLYSVGQSGDEYDIWLVSDHSSRYELMIKIVKGDRPVYSWRGHKYSVFRILGDSLYYVDFHPSGSGGRVVAVDLKTGREVWNSPLKAIGPVQHSAYLNLVNVDANHDVVTVYGNEGAGRYIEIKGAKSGKTVGHKIFSKG